MSHPISLDKLQSAAQSAVPDIARLVQRNASLCSEMPRASHQNEITNPPRMSDVGNPMLSPRQLAAAGLLVAGKTVLAVARQLGIDRATIFRWKRNAHFQAEIRRRADSIGLTPRPNRSPVTRRKGDDFDDAVPNRDPSNRSVRELRESNQTLLAELIADAQKRARPK